MKPELSTEVATYRRRYGLAFVFMSLTVVALSMFVWTSAVAGQSGTAETPQTHPEFPPGEGRDVVLRLCAKCHSPNIILASGRDRSGWESTITKMVRLGAQGSDEDFSAIADYLTANFPPSPVKKLFVNMATDTQLASTLDISLDDAKAIVTYREKVKGFKSLDDMKKVPNVDAKKLDAKKDILVF